MLRARPSAARPRVPGGASPRRWLRGRCLDLAVEPFDEDRAGAAKLVGISIPMHTAIRLGVEAARRVREVNSDCHLCFYGLYASLNAAYLLRTAADSVVGGEFEQPLVALARRLSGQGGNGIRRRRRPGSVPRRPSSAGSSSSCPTGRCSPSLAKYARLETGGEQKLVGYVEASRGCAHRSCIARSPPSTKGGCGSSSRGGGPADIHQLVQMGAQHVTFGDPDFLNGSSIRSRVVRALHAAFPASDLRHHREDRAPRRAPRARPELRALGCLFVVSAVETVSDEVLGYLEKGHTRADVIEALRITAVRGSRCAPRSCRSRRGRPSTTTSTLLEFVEAARPRLQRRSRSSYASACWCPPGRVCSARRR